jgi:CRISPR-associated protein Cmr5
MAEQEVTVSRRQNIEQQRGRMAWDNILEIKALGEKDQQEYRTLARGLNAMIQINGLGQTLGFLKAKSKDKDEQGHPKKNAHYHLLGHLTHWMHEHFDQTIPDLTASKNDGLLKWVLQESTTSADYRRATTECFAFGVWVGRFAEGELKDPQASATQGGNAS